MEMMRSCGVAVSTGVVCCSRGGSPMRIRSWSDAGRPCSFAPTMSAPIETAASRREGTTRRRRTPSLEHSSQNARTPMTLTSGRMFTLAPARSGSSSSYRWCVVVQWLFCTHSSPGANGLCSHVHASLCPKLLSLRLMSFGVPVEPEELKMMPPIEGSATTGPGRRLSASDAPYAGLSTGIITTAHPSPGLIAAARCCSASEPAKWHTALTPAAAHITAARLGGYSGATGIARADRREHASSTAAYSIERPSDTATTGVGPSPGGDRPAWL
mmetsp:Transcript_7181/g.23833  ORF Transcript_7181/g.23833 Transcript_7181/m.23833 type:complete len:271 (-) Transcript_7181:335-1147(-)